MSGKGGYVHIENFPDGIIVVAAAQLFKQQRVAAAYQPDTQKVVAGGVV